MHKRLWWYGYENHCNRGLAFSVYWTHSEEEAPLYGSKSCSGYVIDFGKSIYQCASTPEKAYQVDCYIYAYCRNSGKYPTISKPYEIAESMFDGYLPDDCCDMVWDNCIHVIGFIDEWFSETAYCCMLLVHHWTRYYASDRMNACCLDYFKYCIFLDGKHWNSTLNVLLSWWIRLFH